MKPSECVCVCDIRASSSLWRGKLCLPACDASVQFPHFGLISNFNEGFHTFDLRDTICDFLGGDCFIVTDTFWYIWTVFFLSSLINPLNAKLNPICHLLALLGAHHILHVSRIRVNAVLYHYVDASMLPQYLYVWYVISTVVRISVTCPYTAWHFFSLLYVEHVKVTSS
jgi:hypothetical protein